MLPLKRGFCCFKDIVSQLPQTVNWRIKNFFSTQVVVPKESATLGIPDEVCVGLPLNHHNICKFREPNDSFGCVVRQLNRFISLCPTEDKTHVFTPWQATRYFTGRRNHLQQIHDVLSDPGRRIVVIHGDGGMGKTEVALKYAEEAKQRYDFVLFVDSTSRETFAADLINLHHKIGLYPEDGREVNAVTRLLWLEKKWLLIIDNDDDCLGLNQMALMRLPELNHGHTIITCRGREQTWDPRVNEAICLKPFDLNDARDLLFARAHATLGERALYASHATNAIKRMGTQPLVLDTAGAYMLNSPRGLDCLRSPKDKAFLWQLLSYRPKFSRYQRSVESTLRDTLDEMQSDWNPETYKLLELLVWLDREETTVEFLKRAVSPQTFWGSDGEPVTRHPRESHVPKDIIDLINGPELNYALTELKSHPLIANDESAEEDGTSCAGAILLYPLTYSYVRQKMTADQLIDSAGRALGLMVHAYPEVQGGLERG